MTTLTDLDLNTLVLGWVTAYGSPMVALVLLIGALGIPVPATLIVIASGAFVRQNFLDMYSTPVLGLVGAVTGDVIVYAVGRFARLWIQRRLGQSDGWRKAQVFFDQRGGVAIYLTRWLVTPLAVPVNLIAGSSGYPVSKLLLFDITGELTWIVLYGGLGYAFGSQWELISDFISNFSGMIVGVVLLGAGFYLLFHFQRKSKTVPTPVPDCQEGQVG